MLASGVKDVADMATTIPETVYMMFQMTFAIITPALIAGAFADRMKFSALCIFMTLWSLLVYSPIAHWVWAPSGWANQLGMLDFAGGTVVHINAGIAGLVCALVLGKRVGYGTDNMAPYNLGLRGDRRVAAVGRLVRLQRRLRGRAPTAAPAWRWRSRRSPPRRRRWAGCSRSGSPRANPRCWARFPARSPAWWRSPRPRASCCRAASIIIGIAAGVICFWSATILKHMLGYDDSLDCFGVHGIGGIVGALLTGVFSYGPLSATDASPGRQPGRTGAALAAGDGVAATLVYSGVMTLILLMITKALVGLRVGQEEEREGLDHRAARRADLLAERAGRLLDGGALFLPLHVYTLRP